MTLEHCIDLMTDQIGEGDPAGSSWVKFTRVMSQQCLHFLLIQIITLMLKIYFYNLAFLYLLKKITSLFKLGNVFKAAFKISMAIIV